MVEEVGCRELDLHSLVLIDFDSSGHREIAAEILGTPEIGHTARTVASQCRQHTHIRTACNKLWRGGKGEAAWVDELSALASPAGIAGQIGKQGVVGGAK